MTTKMRLRRRGSAAILASERDLTAFHEAGHAVAHVLTGLPFYDARIWVETDRRGWRRERRWRGVVRPTPESDGYLVADEHLAGLAVVVLAGPEAEARRIHQTDGWHCALSAIRTGVQEDNDYPDGDLDGLPELLADAGVTRAEAERVTADLVAAWWPQIAHIADILQQRRNMMSAEITAVVQRPTATWTSSRNWSTS